jgi:hypothetical protein
VFKFMPEKAANRDDVVTGRAHHVGRGCVPQRRAALLDRRGRGRLQARGILSEYQRWTMEPAAPTLKEAPKPADRGCFFFSFSLFFY